MWFIFSDRLRRSTRQPFLTSCCRSIQRRAANFDRISILHLHASEPSDRRVRHGGYLLLLLPYGPMLPIGIVVRPRQSLDVTLTVAALRCSFSSTMHTKQSFDLVTDPADSLDVKFRNGSKCWFLTSTTSSARCIHQRAHLYHIGTRTNCHLRVRVKQRRVPRP